MKCCLLVECSLHSIRKIREFVRGELANFSISEITANQITLAVEETCCNSIIHGNATHTPHEHLSIDVALKEDTVIVEIQDPSPSFDMNNFQSKSCSALMEARHSGGMGIHLVKKIMDRVEIRDADGKGVYILQKKIR